MLDIYTVSFFGHRHIDDLSEVERRLEQAITELISTKEYVDFLVGRNGEFDMLAASAVRRVRKKLDNGNSSLVLVLPYSTAEYRNNSENFESYYDDVEVCSESSGTHFKAAIQTRNRSVIDRSDLIICNIGYNSGGAYRSVLYACGRGKRIMNLSDSKFFVRNC